MNTNHFAQGPDWKWLTTCGLMLVVGLSASLSSAADQPAAALFDEAAFRTVFAFDQVSIPHTQNLRLEMRAPAKHPANPVVPRGGPGTPDSWAVQFYGSVIREGGKFRMWYVAAGDERTEGKEPRSAPWRAAYAESHDGVTWIKPNLGLVEYRGNKNNNLILTDPAPLGILNLKVLADPDEPNPERRYKISTHVWFPKGKSRFGTLAPFASADGLRWKMLTDARPVAAELAQEDLVLPAIHFEPCGGLYKWEGMYYASGQNASIATRPYHGRVVRMVHSPDFVQWSHTSAIGFVRAAQHTLLGAGRSREGEQTHEGISVWNRGNVLLGVYGIWHGAKEWKDVTIDLGFVVSNDGLNFREPAHEWTFLERGEDGAWDQGGLLQGQGFENVGDQTFIYYGAWDPRHWEGSPPRGGVGIATLPRDRFGDLVVEEAAKGPGDYQLPVIQSEFITAAVPSKAHTAHRFYLNAAGLGAAAALKIELLGEKEQPLPGYSGGDAAVVRQSGFQTPIAWDGKKEAHQLPERIRIRVTFEGERKSDIRFSALYVQAGS
ncbi:MAG: hypothetical protein M3463_09020 [Verrucomicrobiota bacterium]|nr:hypothetical protein [Verrucomicrobiota bacterium]